MEGKWSLRMTQNADITLTDCFVPEKNKLTHAKDFATGTNAILESSRLVVAWMACGLAAGAYENKEQLRASIKEELLQRLAEAKGAK